MIPSLLLLIVVLMLIGSFPTWPHSRNWGYRPSGVMSILAIVLIILLLTGRL
jgi:hypothetical protein